MYKNLTSFIGEQNVLTIKNRMLYVLTILIFAACFTTGCENRSSTNTFSTELLKGFSEGLLDLNQTATVTLQEKDGSGITGTATFTEYVDSDTASAGSTSIRNFDVEIQGADSDRKYAAYIYSGNSCDTPGNIWDVDGFDSYSFTTDEDGTVSRSYLTDLTIDTNPETGILGKVLVIHEQVDSGDLVDGTQVSCGVITLSE